jgi:hypothetical protein
VQSCRNLFGSRGYYYFDTKGVAGEIERQFARFFDLTISVESVRAHYVSKIVVKNDVPTAGLPPFTSSGINARFNRSSATL